MENTKLNEDQLVNNTPVQAQPIPATQSEIAQAIPPQTATTAMDPFTATTPATGNVTPPASDAIEDVSTTSPEVTPTDTSIPADPFTPPAPGMIPSGWINPEDLAAAVAQVTGDVEAAQTAPDATVTTEPVIDTPALAPATPNIAAPTQPEGNTLQFESLSDDERRIIEKYRALKEASNKVDELIHDAPAEANEECKKDFNDILDDATSVKIPESLDKKDFGDHPTDKDLDVGTKNPQGKYRGKNIEKDRLPESVEELDKKDFGDHPTDKDLDVGTKHPQGKYRGDKKGTDGDFESQGARCKDDTMGKGLHPDATEMATSLHESEEMPESEGELGEDLGEVTGQAKLERDDIERAMEGNMPESEDIDIAPDPENKEDEDSEEEEEIVESEEIEDQPESEETEKEKDQPESEEAEEEEQPESEDIIVNDEAIDAVKDEVLNDDMMAGVFEDDNTLSNSDALSRIEAFLDDNTPEQVEDLSNALKSTSNFLDFLVNKPLATDEDDDVIGDISGEEIEEILNRGVTPEDEGLPVKDDRPDPFTESVHRMKESEENPKLPYTLIAVHSDGTEEVIKTLDKNAFDEYFLYMDNFEGAPSYDDLYDDDLEVDDTEETTLENFKALRDQASEKAWDLFADDYYLTIAELASDEKNGKFESNNTFDYEAVVEKLADMDDLIDFKLYKNGSEMPGVSHDIVMDLYSDIFTTQPEMPYVEETEVEEVVESSKPVRRTREALLEARKGNNSNLKEDSQIKYPAGSQPITSQIQQEEKKVQEAKEQDIIKEYEKKIQERKESVAKFRENLKRNRYRNAAASNNESEITSFNEALKGSMRLSEERLNEDSLNSNSWSNNKFIDKYVEAKKLSFKDLTNRMNDHYFG